MTEYQAPAGIRGFLAALASQARVIHALLLREMQVRFGRDNIGLLWMIVEPMLFAGAVTLIHSMAGPDHGSKAQNVFPFTVIGYCLFIIFRNIFNRSDGAIESASPLLYHRMVTPFDVLFARAIVDAVGCICALAVLLAIGVMLGLSDPPARPIYLIAAAILIFWLSFGFALVIASYTYEGEVLGRLVHPFSYVMLPLSGAFVTMSFLPTWAREYMAWNPMMTIFEMARYGHFQDSDDRYVYWGYAVVFCAAVTYWGLLALRGIRSKIHVG